LNLIRINEWDIFNIFILKIYCRLPKFIHIASIHGQLSLFGGLVVFYFGQQKLKQLIQIGKVTALIVVTNSFHHRPPFITGRTFAPQAQ